MKKFLDFMDWLVGENPFVMVGFVAVFVIMFISFAVFFPIFAFSTFALAWLVSLIHYIRKYYKMHNHE